MSLSGGLAFVVFHGQGNPQLKLIASTQTAGVDKKLMLSTAIFVVAHYLSSTSFARRRTRIHWRETVIEQCRTVVWVSNADCIETARDRYVTKLLPPACLAPEIVASILQGTQPVDLTAETLAKRVDLPLGWSEQKALLGFDRR